MEKIVFTMKRIARAVQLGPKAVRMGGGLAPTLMRALSLYRREGFAGIVRGFRTVAYSGQIGGQFAAANALGGKLPAGPAGLLRPRVLIIAELSIPQCTKYRVMQKREMLHHLGLECTVVSWTDAAACFTGVATHALVIFYRVPAFAHVENLIAEARRLRVPTCWEVDDLIFDKELLASNSSLQKLDKATREGAFRGAVMYRKAMLLCDYGVASTTGLQSAMATAGVSNTFVVENALDASTLEAAERANACACDHAGDGTVRIVYGSGTNTHNEDFEEASDAILRILHRYSHVRLRLIGLLDLPTSYDAVKDRIERIEFCNYQEYLQHLAVCDINIAPLEPGQFNDAKSNIKFLEASSVRLPSVCSPREAFKTAIHHGLDGFLCDNTEDWECALASLVDNPQLRREVGAAAYSNVMARYLPQSIAQSQVQPLVSGAGGFLTPIEGKQAQKLKVLSVNVLYSPRSFGGATVVAEQTNALMAQREDIALSVFTSLAEDLVPAYVLRRYSVSQQTIFGVGIPPLRDAALSFDNPRVTAAFKEVLDAVAPDLVHFHSIQDIGVGALDACLQANIPYIVTAHDAWWVCGRQFMVTRSGAYCRQQSIDVDRCATCVDDANLNRFRQARLASALRSAAKILTPSSYFADFYQKNGFDKTQLLVNRNGIRRAMTSSRMRQPGPLRFGYVGGNIALKGVELVRSAFRNLTDIEVRLVVVDNALNLGSSSFPDDFFKEIPTAQIVPAYTQDTLDAFFETIDVLLFPTQAKESFGLTVREALARNVWVITTDAGGVVEDIISGRNGLIIPFDSDASSLEAAVLQTVEFYAGLPVGAPISLPRESITYFEEQATELAEIYRRVAVKERTGAMTEKSCGIDVMLASQCVHPTTIR